VSNFLKVELGVGATLLGGKSIPLGGLGVVLRHALATGIHKAEVGLGLSVTLLGAFHKSRIYLAPCL
jgi:hypothetical protein